VATAKAKKARKSKPQPVWDLTTAAGRFKARWNYFWTDHAFLRLVFQNAFWIDDKLVRANQPSPHHLAFWKKRGIRTIINLRGGFDGSFYAIEKDACEKLGLNLVSFTVTSRDAPSREQVLGAVDLFNSIEYPALMHCKSGADRAGIMSVLYRYLHKGEPIEEAVKELGFHRLHIKHGKTGVLDYVFERYFEEGKPKGLSFLEWVKSPEYDHKQIKADFRTSWWGSALTERLLKRE
jgi:protein tyrosine/serine phosphatase